MIRPTLPGPRPAPPTPDPATWGYAGDSVIMPAADAVMLWEALSDWRAWSRALESSVEWDE